MGKSAIKKGDHFSDPLSVAVEIMRGYTKLGDLKIRCGAKDFRCSIAPTIGEKGVALKVGEIGASHLIPARPGA